ncbi:hypothetical protein ASPCAL10160 [Aspergillus calidoustus]|uniref:Zn(2)-C6 fungal-type domain-containing protein n=1 Tax=Aspergillus calidoustus TaxID=454130 RepID=A0A0U5G500_ASPCI|nr:hypothetical protein ASPCAL10160 [Aspergillus calidoustus]
MPDGDGAPRRRPRPIISCLRCREKKLKCDRVAPCDNCKKAGLSSDCAYQHDPDGSKRLRLADDGDTSNSRLTLDSGKVGIIEGLQQRMKRLEDLLAVNPHNPFLASFALDDLGAGGDRRVAPSSNGPALNVPSPDLTSATPSSNTPSSIAPSSNGTPGAPPDAPSSASPYPGVLVVKGTRTLYHGQTNRVSLLHQYSDAKTFINHECNMSSPIFRLAKEIQFLQSRSKVPNSPESIFESGTSELQQLRERLPPYNICDRLVDLYAANLEKTFRIFHIPTFKRHFARFTTGDLDADQTSAFLAQLTAVLVAGLPFVETQFRLDFPTIHGYLQNDALNIVRGWLRKLGRKQRTETSTLQTEAIVILARQLRRDSPGDLWQATGELVRSAMVIGLHLDLSKVTGISPFDKEIRRRLWITIAEMDLQASIASGMPVTIPDMDFGPLTAANLKDTDFDESVDELPPGRPTSEWTEALPQVLLAGSLRTRIRTMLFVQSGTCNLTQAAQYANDLQDHLHNIVVLDPPTRPGKTAAMLFNSVLVDLYTRRPLICLNSFITKIHPKQNVRNVSLDLCFGVLVHQDHFDPSMVDLDVPAFWEIFQIFCKNDILRAALYLCEHIKKPEVTSPTPHTKASLIRTVENALKGLIASFSHPNSSFKDVLLLAVEFHLARSGGMKGEKKELVHRGVLEALSACRERLISSSAQQQGNLAQMLQTQQLCRMANSAYTPISFSQFPDLGDPSLFGAEFDNFMPFDDDAIGAFFADF